MTEVRHTIDELQLRVTLADGALVSGGGGGAVDSVNGHTGVVVLAASDVGAQPVDSDLTAIAALTTTTFGRALLALADAPALRTVAGLGTAATQATSAFDAAGAAASAQAASQPLDSDLTAIAALTTTTFGRSLLTQADAAAARATLGAGTSSLALGTTSSTAKAGDYQPASTNISDASTIGKTILTAANAAAVRAAITVPTLAWFNVKDYGATGNGSTDDTTAINLAIAALNTATRGVLYFPAGSYVTSASLTAITAIGVVLGEGCSKAMTFAAATQITTSSNSTPILTINGHATTVRGIGFKCVSGTTPVSGSTGILVTEGDGCRYEDLSFEHFYIDMDVQDGSEWYMTRCFFYDPVKYGLKIRHIDLPDGGDAAVTSCQFIAGTFNADAAIRQESGGGLKFTGNKINMRVSNQFFVGLDIAVVAATGVLTVTGNSFENLGDRAIKGSGTFQSVAITGNQFGYYASKTVPVVDIGGWNDVTVVGNTFMNTNSCTTTAVLLTSVTNGAVGLNSFRGFTGEYTLTTCTGINVVPAAGMTDPSTTKGDILARTSSALARLGVGSDGQVLTADAASTPGVKWATPASGFADPMTTKGDLIVHGSSTTRLGIGTDGYVLTADAASTNGLKWAAVSASGGWTKVIDLPLTTLTGWTAGAGTWGASGSGIAQSGAGASNRLFYNTLVDQGDIVVQAEIRVDTMSAGGHVGFVFGAPPTDTSGGLEASLTGSTSNTTGVYCENDAVAGGATITLGSAIAHSTFITLKLHKVGTLVSYYVSGTLVGALEMATASSSLTQTPMRLAFKTANATATIRNLVAYVPTLPI